MPATSQTEGDIEGQREDQVREETLMDPSVRCKDRVKSISEHMVLMTFPALLMVLSISQEFLQKNENSATDQEHEINVKQEQHSVQGYIYGSIIVSTLSSNFGIMSWIRVAVKFHPICFFSLFEEKLKQNLNFVYKFCTRFASNLVHFSGLGAMCTSVMILYMLEVNRNELACKVIFAIALLVILSFLIVLTVRNFSASREGSLIDENGNTPPPNENQAEFRVPESMVEQLDSLLEFSTGVTEQFFGAMVLSVYDYFKNLANSDKDTGESWSLVLICLGSNIGVVSTLLNCLSLRTTHSQIDMLRILNSLLLLFALFPVITFSYRMLNGMAYLELVPLGLSFVIAGLACCAPLLRKLARIHVYLKNLVQNPVIELRNPVIELMHKPVSLTFANIAYAGFVAASGYSGNHKDTDVHKFVTFWVSTALVSALTWRFIDQEMKKNSFFELFEKVLCFCTLVSLFFGLLYSMKFVFVAVPTDKATS